MTNLYPAANAFPVIGRRESARLIASPPPSRISASNSIVWTLSGIALAACGGGGGGSSPVNPGGPVNNSGSNPGRKILFDATASNADDSGPEGNNRYFELPTVQSFSDFRDIISFEQTGVFLGLGTASYSVDVESGTTVSVDGRPPIRLISIPVATGVSVDFSASDETSRDVYIVAPTLRELDRILQFSPTEYDQFFASVEIGDLDAFFRSDVLNNSNAYRLGTVYTNGVYPRFEPAYELQEGSLPLPGGGRANEGADTAPHFIILGGVTFTAVDPTAAEKLRLVLELQSDAVTDPITFSNRSNADELRIQVNFSATAQTSGFDIETTQVEVVTAWNSAMIDHDGDSATAMVRMDTFISAAVTQSLPSNSFVEAVQASNENAYRSDEVYTDEAFSRFRLETNGQGSMSLFERWDAAGESIRIGYSGGPSALVKGGHGDPAITIPESGFVDDSGFVADDDGLTPDII